MVFVDKHYFCVHFCSEIKVQVQIWALFCNILIHKIKKVNIIDLGMYSIACFSNFFVCIYWCFASGSAVVLNLSWFVAPFQRLSTLVAPCSSERFCNIIAELCNKGLCLWPPGNRSVILVEKPWGSAYFTEWQKLLYTFLNCIILRLFCITSVNIFHHLVFPAYSIFAWTSCLILSHYLVPWLFVFGFSMILLGNPILLSTFGFYIFLVVCYLLFFWRQNLSWVYFVVGTCSKPLLLFFR